MCSRPHEYWLPVNASNAASTCAAEEPKAGKADQLLESLLCTMPKTGKAGHATQQRTTKMARACGQDVRSSHRTSGAKSFSFKPPTSPSMPIGLFTFLDASIALRTFRLKRIGTSDMVSTPPTRGQWMCTPYTFSDVSNAPSAKALYGAQGRQGWLQNTSTNYTNLLA